MFISDVVNTPLSHFENVYSSSPLSKKNSNYIFSLWQRLSLSQYWLFIPLLECSLHSIVLSNFSISHSLALTRSLSLTRFHTFSLTHIYSLCFEKSYAKSLTDHLIRRQLVVLLFARFSTFPIFFNCWTSQNCNLALCYFSLKND